MRSEKITEDQIRVTISSEELMKSGFTLSDLSYGDPETNRLFGNILSYIGENFDFHTDGDPYMIEAVPMQDGALVLLISRGFQPDEVDTRFARFSHAPGGLTAPLSSSVEDALSSLTPENYERLVNAVFGGSTAKTSAPSEEQVFAFRNLEDCITLSHLISGVYDGQSALYRDPSGSRLYYMVFLPFPETSALAAVSEYGQTVPAKALSSRFIREHFTPVIRHHAVETLAGL